MSYYLKFKIYCFWLIYCFLFNVLSIKNYVVLYMELLIELPYEKYCKLSLHQVKTFHARLLTLIRLQYNFDCLNYSFEMKISMKSKFRWLSIYLPNKNKKNNFYKQKWKKNILKKIVSLNLIIFLFSSLLETW